jgi:hypothetical protein
MRMRPHRVPEPGEPARGVVVVFVIAVFVMRAVFVGFVVIVLVGFMVLVVGLLVGFVVLVALVVVVMLMVLVVGLLVLVMLVVTGRTRHTHPVRMPDKALGGTPAGTRTATSAQRRRKSPRAELILGTDSSVGTLLLSAVRSERQQVSHAVVMTAATSPRCRGNTAANDSKVPTLRLHTPP